MYANSMRLWPGGIPWANSAAWEDLAATYHLPTLAALASSTKTDHRIGWEGVEATVEIERLHNLRRADRRPVFAVRYKTVRQAREYTSAFVSLTDDLADAHMISLAFPPQGDRACHSMVLGRLKDIARKHPGRDLIFEVAGYGERADLLFVREHSLSAFAWHEELARYLHVRADVFSEVKEVAKGVYQRSRWRSHEKTPPTPSRPPRRERRRLPD